MQTPLIAAIEAGGTKFNLTVGYRVDQPLRQTRVDTTTPSETLRACQLFLRDAVNTYGPLAGIGIASFGPVCIDPNSPHYGQLLDTPKPGWSGADLRAALLEFNCPIRVDTDVNAAALAEYHARGFKDLSLAYVTLGTGLGVGLCNKGESLSTQLHPELGHLHSIPIKGEPNCTCPFHAGCIEGLICGPALAKRWQIEPKNAPTDHPLWDNVAHHLATLCHIITLAYSPHTLVVGGGVMQRAGMYERLQKAFQRHVGTYLGRHSFRTGIEQFIEPPRHVDAGLVGAFYLANTYLTGQPL
ncbi:ROK family protein [Simiduia curdlanivorans]|uniref:fructokinase n=1 Tax=Simiduia curdlanivorans TaxID=1492769 RepID=A0ABV8V670_9GAMM|nr:ROK family protein [Simiduia curdlanivorans]MDN3638728.1 ROK family protein [Simiduia curdlanivorans]